MSEDELMEVIRAGIDRVAALRLEDREPALANLQRSATRIATLLGFSPFDAHRFADELVTVLRDSAAAMESEPVRRVLH